MAKVKASRSRAGSGAPKSTVHQVDVPMFAKSVKVTLWYLEEGSFVPVAFQKVSLVPDTASEFAAILCSQYADKKPGSRWFYTVRKGRV